MLVSFTGAQSTGKTTLLTACCNTTFFRRFHCVTEVTRKIRREYNLDINEEGDNVTQLFILREHLHNHYLRGNALLDRCILDGVVYTQYLTNHGKVAPWVYRYALELLNLLGPRLDVVFYTSPDDIPIEDDGERSIDKSFRNEIIDIFETYMRVPILKGKVVRLEGDVATRMDVIKFECRNRDIDNPNPV